MAMTSVERQRRYRQRHLREGARVRREFILTAHADMALDRLVRHYALPVTAVIARVIADAESAVVDGLSRAQRNVYFADQMRDELAKAARRHR